MFESMYNRLSELFPEMVKLRRHFHMNPELSFMEVKTPATIADYLTELGVEVRTGVGGRGVVGLIRGGKPGKTVAIRADFDALAIQDQKDVEYKSQIPGVMHACGHDAHTATLLTVAKVLVENKDELEGNVVLIHQFAEEIAPGGALPMIEDGCLDGVDAIFGTHLWSTMPVGEIGYRSGPVMAAADKFTIEIKGRGGHGAAPHETVDSIMVGTSLVQSLQQIVSRRVNPLKPAVVTVAAFHAGDAFNVIADSATIIGTVRTFDPEVQDQIIAEMERLTKSTCDGAGASYTFTFDKGYPAVVNHPAETNLLTQCAKLVVPAEQVKEMAPIMGGEDFSYYLQKVPGTFFFTGAGNPETGAEYPHHHPKFDIDEQSMLTAAKVLLTAAVTYLQEEAAKQAVATSK
ncbi:M20 family metallopeptidase [Ammoniphilus sp. CFH 90114]|uniref:M20 family metallopeptidase n=1 Tax=Ammoniphilus sp. CFH 90114 TaxID=2493665 RepID=UPI00100F1F47|nr:M20 family metallopeptidase [Ammoniphilus sp. CFH 90114]RXT04343.1 amidohydrolase [Ammoniphilus sp. CFH 90114]